MSTDGIETWIESTTAFDRVQSISMVVEQPQPVSYIAEEAHVSENTARSHLERLVELGLLHEVSEGRGSCYYPEPLYGRMRLLRELFSGYDQEGLMEHRVDLMETIEEWEAEFDVEEPSELRETAADAESVEVIQELKKTASEWETMQYRLSVVEEAIRHYDAYSEPIPSGNGSSA